MSLIKHAEYEMKRAGLYDKDSDYGGMLPEAVMALIRAHSEQGHSGMSHAITLSIFNQVVNFKTLTPLTSDPDEWHEVTDMTADGTPLWQNKRQSSCFSKDHGHTWYDIDAPRKEA